MPSYLDFDSTKRFRDFIIGKTLNRPNGPQTFTESSYTVQTLSELSNTDLPDVDFNRGADLLQPQNSNIFKPFTYFVTENINTLPRRANLQLYPYFNSVNHNLISVMSNSNYDTESELMKFAAFNIRQNPNGPVLARISRNLEAATNGRLRFLDALNGNTATAINIITGREPLVEFNNKITVAKTLPGKAIDFLQTVAGVEFPFSEIPGDYLTDPRNPINNRPESRTELGRVIQDVTGALGSLFGIQRRPKLDRKPSDLMIEYMGAGQKSSLYDNLSFSTYAPNYTTTARSQNSSKIFNFIDNAAQGVRNLLGLEAPAGVAYIGDDRGNDVKYAMGDFNDRQIRSSYYLSFMFDPVQAQLFQRDKNLSQGGGISGNLTWISKNSKNKPGTHNQEWDSEQSTWVDTLSTKFEFREDSILGYTQELLDTLPLDGATSRTHVANVIDQTSRFFKDGDILMSRGSAVKYVKNGEGQEGGIEFCRVWTKDRSYMNYSDTMKKTGNIRKYGGSVVSHPWNLNIGPMSNGRKDFSQSTNIFKSERGKDIYNGGNDSFFAKKYMFSIENLAWKSSKLPGFTVQDLPYCERGPNGGRVMWFPPYDLKISEQNSAKWEENSFLGRPEPIYTYQNTTRSGQVSFKVIVDHPSILNLLVREHFEGMSDEDSDNYINAFFSGCEEIDFYDLIRRYTTITPDDVEKIKTYLEGGTDSAVIQKYRVESDPIVPIVPDTTPEKIEGVKLKTSLLFANDRPSGGSSEFESLSDYTTLYNVSLGNNQPYIDKSKSDLEETLTTLLNLSSSTDNSQSVVNARKDIKTLFKQPDGKIDSSLHTEKIEKQKELLQKEIDKGVKNFNEYEKQLNTLKDDITKGNVQEITITALSSCSAVADDVYNFKLSIRRSHSIFKDIVKRLGGTDGVAKWIETPNGSATTITKLERVVSFKDLGFADREGNLIFKATNAGEKVVNEENDSCSEVEFISKSLKVNTAIAFGCRQSKVEFNYTKAVKQQENQTPTNDNVPPRTRLILEDGTPPSGRKKPPIDIMKKIVMKSLSECYYFKTLEEKDPVVFGSLKEKLKYFHPGFHSMTPEGLNARLTFLNQCVRPGNTIPIKGLSDDLDLNARNTTFGPPPICVLRIGDFYHSKIVIRDVNITFDDTTWDMNPEGIGMQPMLANVSLQVAFIGGQGLDKPVERLQNALSSNFYANTEMYDERATATVENPLGKSNPEFTKWFLEGLQVATPPAVDSSNSSDGNVTVKDLFIGVLSSDGKSLDYTTIVKDVFTKTDDFFTLYNSAYKDVNKEFGPLIMKMLFSPQYREINKYDIFNTTSTTPGSTIDIFGIPKGGTPHSQLVGRLKKRLLDFTKNEDISTIIGFEKVLTLPQIVKSNELLKPYLTKYIGEKIDGLLSNSKVTGLEQSRDSLIESLDKVNFLVKYGYDAKLEKDGGANKAVLSGYTYDLIYNEYSSCVEYIVENTDKLYEKINNTIDFKTITLTPEIYGSILSTLLSFEDGKTKLMNTFSVDTTIFNTNTIEKLTKRLDKFVEEPDNVEFKFKKFKNRKTDTPITFQIIPPSTPGDEVINDDEIIIQLTSINSPKSPIRNGKLNYYRNPKKTT
jgi:hypothetical protein